MSELDKCREEFESYIVTRYPNRSKKMVTRRLKEIDGYQFYTFKEIEDAWTIWQHLQAKVEELQKRVDAATELTKKYKHDAHDLSLIGDFDKSRVYNGIANQLDQLLKGGA